MNKLKILISAAAAILVVLLSASWLSMSATAQMPGVGSRPNGECVAYGSGSSLHMCMHKFADGTRCVASGGGGLASAGAGAALQCDFKEPLN